MAKDTQRSAGVKLRCDNQDSGFRSAAVRHFSTSRDFIPRRQPRDWSRVRIAATLRQALNVFFEPTGSSVESKIRAAAGTSSTNPAEHSPAPKAPARAWGERFVSPASTRITSEGCGAFTTRSLPALTERISSPRSPRRFSSHRNHPGTPAFGPSPVVPQPITPRDLRFCGFHVRMFFTSSIECHESAC